MSKRRDKKKNSCFDFIKEPRQVPISIGKDKSDELDYPIFSFKYLQDVSYLESDDADFLSKFINRLHKLSNLGWKEIRTSHRHAFGTEQLAYEQIKPKDKIPSFITPEIKFTVFRAHGDNRPFLGIQDKNIFHIIFIEANFGDIYDH